MQKKKKIETPLNHFEFYKSTIKKSPQALIKIFSLSSVGIIFSLPSQLTND